MKICSTIQEMRTYVQEERKKGHTIGLVPTMGYLHEGHLSLVARAKEMVDRVVMSVFVNPLQFSPGEDYERYPRDRQHDEAMARKGGVDALFLPSVEEMYPRPSLTFVEVEKLTETLCGLSRPGHFRGVATVVTKLFHIVQPDLAFFGQKDIQQVRVIEQMVEDLNFPLQIVTCPIVREEDGLAQSSRNVYLTPAQRQQATSLYASLQLAEQAFAKGERESASLIQLVRQRIAQEPEAQVEYIRIVSKKNLEDLSYIDQPAILALAVRFGHTRLIDNTILQP